MIEWAIWCRQEQYSLPVAKDIPLQYNCIYLEEKAVDPIGETMSDYEIVAAIAEKMGAPGRIQRHEHRPDIPVTSAGLSIIRIQSSS